MCIRDRAAIIINNERKTNIKGSKKNTTNNQMELLAPIEALKKIPKGSKVQIFTDSKYVKSGITDWIHNWKKNGWKTANKQEVKNKDLWTELDILVNEFKVAQFAGYVSEHSGYHHGEMSLNMAIVKLAQEFVGSNNINEGAAVTIVNSFLSASFLNEDNYVRRVNKFEN